MSVTAGAGLEGAFADARALLDTMVSSGWQELHVCCGELEIFIALADGCPNPMRSASDIPAVSASPIAATTVTAPHVATLVDMLAPGVAVVAGEPVARIQVLGREETLLAPVAGRVSAVHAVQGDLLEFGVGVLSLTESDG